MRSSPFVAMFAPPTAALATVGAALRTVGAANATAPTSDPSLDEAALEFAQCMRDNGIEDFADTGDVHLGDVAREYSSGLTVEHNGLVNGTAALAEQYPDATQVVVVGKSIGSVAVPIYGGPVADLLPDAQVTVFGGQSGHIPDPDPNAELASCGRLRQPARLGGQRWARRPRPGAPRRL